LVDFSDKGKPSSAQLQEKCAEFLYISRSNLQFAT